MFRDISPIEDFTGNLSLEFVDYRLGEPKYDLEESKNRDATYAAPLRVKVRLIIKETGEVKEQEVFMGDLGSLSIGAAMGTLAVIVRQEIVLMIMAGIFVVETFSVVIQVGYFRYTKNKYGKGRRIFLMAPLHHHYEKKGWKETQVVVRFWIITMMLVLIGLASLKIR